MGGKPPKGKGTRITENESKVEEFRITSESNRQTRGPGPWQVGLPVTGFLWHYQGAMSAVTFRTSGIEIILLPDWPARNYNRHFREPMGSFTPFSPFRHLETLKPSRQHHPGGKPPVSLVYILFRLCLIEAQFTWHFLCMFFYPFTYNFLTSRNSGAMWWVILISQQMGFSHSPVSKCWILTYRSNKSCGLH